MKKQLYISLLLGIWLFFISLLSFAKTKQTILPIKFSPQGVPSTTIEVQGKVIPLLFESGAAKTNVVLNEKLLKTLKIKFSSKKDCFHDDTGKKICLKTFIIPKLKIGKFTMYNIMCDSMHHLWGGKAGFKGLIWTQAERNGLIGLSLLQNFGVLVDYPHARVILTKKGEYPVGYDMKEWIRIPFDNRYSGVTTSAKINNKNAVLVWDTGATPSVMKSTANINAKKMPCGKVHPNNKCYFVDPFIVSNKQLAKTWFVIKNEKFPVDGLIGTNFFKENSVFIDFKYHMLFIKHIEG